MNNLTQMKNIFLLCLLLCFSIFLCAQSIETKWETIYKKPDLLINFRVIQSNSQVTLELKFHLGNHGDFSVSDTNSLWLKIINGSTIKLHNKWNEISADGGGSISTTGITVPGIYVKYDISDNLVDTLAVNFISKIRIFTSKGFTDVPIGDWSGSMLCYAFREIKNKRNSAGTKKDDW